ncbi:MAG TPA: hypothetical protein VK196_13190 [Magnetospirillum sp.]|nr:hypothetical protein [Magnetospirillum sp.]
MPVPCVGIFWFVRDADGVSTLLADKTSIDAAEPYGDCLTHPTGHAEFWDGLSRLGAAGLKARGLPTAPAWHEYEEFPRGRVVYWPGNQRFVIYADRRLHRHEFINQIAAEFDLPEGRYTVQADPHYRRQPRR